MTDKVGAAVAFAVVLLGVAFLVVLFATVGVGPA